MAEENSALAEVQRLHFSILEHVSDLRENPKYSQSRESLEVCRSEFPSSDEYLKCVGFMTDCFAVLE